MPVWCVPGIGIVDLGHFSPGPGALMFPPHRLKEASCHLSWCTLCVEIRSKPPHSVVLCMQ